MAKIYKAEIYFVDYNGEYENADRFEDNLKQELFNLDVGAEITEMKESEEFEWDDNLIINKIDSSKEDYDVYFKK